MPVFANLSGDPLTNSHGAIWAAPAAASPIRAEVSLPGSKSLTNRELILSALAEGPSVVERALRSRDTELMATALTRLGSSVAMGTDSEPLTDWAVRPGEFAGPVSIDCGLAGTVMRFVPPAAGLARGSVMFDGDLHARTRPMAQIIHGLRGVGIDIRDAGRGLLPFSVFGTGSVTGGQVTIDASASSQFVSALLLSAARYDQGIEVLHDGKPVPSLPHIDMTVAALRRRGVEVDDHEANRWRVHPSPIKGMRVSIEPDLSNAAPFLAAGALSGGEVTVRDWPTSTTQAGDRLRDILAMMGADVVLDERGLTVGGSGGLQGIDYDLHDVGELTPAVAALCALAEGPSVLRGVEHIRGHETDRLTALATELERVGARVSERRDGLAIQPGPLTAETMETYADHRMAHAACIIGLKVPGTLVRDIATTAKTYPQFARDWSKLVADSDATPSVVSAQD